MRPLLLAIGGSTQMARQGVVALRALLAGEPISKEARADAFALLDSVDVALRFAAAPDPEQALAATAEELAAQVRAADAPDPSPRCAAPWCRRYVPRAGAYCMAHAGQLDAGEGAP